MPRSPRTRRAPAALLLAATLAAATACNDPTPDPEPSGGPVPEHTASEEPTEETTHLSADVTDVTVAATIATDLHTPWDVAFTEDGSPLVTLRDSGEVVRIDDDGGVIQLDAGGPSGAIPGVHHETEDGLLGIAVGPDQGIYLYLTTSSDNRVIRMDVDGNDLVNPRLILDGIPSARNHNGGRLAFGPDDYLYVTTGDAMQKELAQDTDSLGGKILRVTAEGEPAPGNPFGNEVWSYGHRNVQGLGWTSDGQMYASEFGSDEFDELNLIEPGGNYGWPLIEGWAGDPDYIDPLVTWPTPQASPSGIAVTDTGVWMTGLRGERLWYIPLQADGAVGDPRPYLDLGRLRAVVISPDDALWVVTSNTDGRGDPKPSDDRIVRLETS